MMLKADGRTLLFRLDLFFSSQKEYSRQNQMCIRDRINSNTKANIKRLTVNKSSLENDNIVSVKLEKKFKYNTSETKTKLLHIKRIAATEITSGYASGYVQRCV